MIAETVHGILRGPFLAPRLGDFAARQVSALNGSLLVLVIATLLSGWIGAGTKRALTRIGLLWLVLTLMFEFTLGRLVGYSWDRILEDYNLLRGGLLMPAMVFLAFVPRIAEYLRSRFRAATR